MKKIILLLFGFSLLFIFTKGEEEILIPNQAIRFRVVANSDSLEDQTQKLMIKEDIEKDIYQLISGASSSLEVRNILESNMDKIKRVVDRYHIPYQVSYGSNYFPVKNYKGVLYPAGNYESLVITLGEGLGNNFWCVLFPPLCLLDYEQRDVGEVEYQFYVKKLLEKF